MCFLFISASLTSSVVISRQHHLCLRLRLPLDVFPFHLNFAYQLSCDITSTSSLSSLTLATRCVSFSSQLLLPALLCYNVNIISVFAFACHSLFYLYLCVFLILHY